MEGWQCGGLRVRCKVRVKLVNFGCVTVPVIINYPIVYLFSYIF